MCSDYIISFDTDYRETKDFKLMEYPSHSKFFEDEFVYCIENKLSVFLTHTLERNLTEDETVESLISEDIEYYVHSLKESYHIPSFLVGMNFDSGADIYR